MSSPGMYFVMYSRAGLVRIAKSLIFAVESGTSVKTLPEFKSRRLRKMSFSSALAELSAIARPKTVSVGRATTWPFLRALMMSEVCSGEI